MRGYVKPAIQRFLDAVAANGELAKAVTLKVNAASVRVSSTDPHALSASRLLAVRAGAMSARQTAGAVSYRF